MGNTRTRKEGLNVPCEQCTCMKDDSWNVFSAMSGATIGQHVRELVDSSGACEMGVRDILVSILVGSILAAEGQAGVRDIDGLLAEVKRRISQ